MPTPFKSNMYTPAVQVVSGTSALKNKRKAGGIGIDSADGYKLKWNANGTIITANGGLDAPVASGGTSRTLTAANVGTTNKFDSAAGITYTLPTPVAGMRFSFIWTVLQTSSAHVITAGAGIFLLGTVEMFSGADVTPSATLGPKSFAGNGTSHIKISTDGTTTGGGIGSWVDVIALSATQWWVRGKINSPSGTIATPFST